MQAIRDLSKLHPKVQEMANKLLALCKKEGLNIGISETYRTVERQDYLYAQGRTRAGNIVTYAKGSSKSSYHQWGLAFDVFQNIKGKEYDMKVLTRVGEIGESIGLEWGGRFKGFVDATHFQYTFGLSTQDLNNGKLPKEEDQDNSQDDSQDDRENTSEDKEGEEEADKKDEKDDYLEAVDTLVKAKVIGMPEIWRTKSYKNNHVESLIIKMARLYQEGKTTQKISK